LSRSDDYAMERKYLKDRNLHIIFSITLIAVMGVSSVTPAFPAIRESLGLSNQQVGWLITFFSGPGIVLTPLLGVLADRYGRKTVLIPSLLLYSLAGFGCFFTRDFEVLLLLRFLQGSGAAALGSLNITLVGDIYPSNERAKVMGINASVLSIGTASYPAIGGALSLLGWHYPFLLPLLGIPVAVAVFLGLDNPEPQSHRKFLSYMKATLKSINRPEVIVIFIASFVVFVILFGGFLTYFPLLMDAKFSSDSFIIGLLMTSMSGFTAIVSSQLGPINKLIPESRLIHFGFLGYALSFALIPIIQAPLWMLVPIALFGIGHGINFPSIQTRLTLLSSLEYRGAFMSLNGMVLRAGQAFGPPIVAWFSTFGGINVAFWITGSLAFITFIFALIFIKPQKG